MIKIEKNIPIQINTQDNVLKVAKQCQAMKNGDSFLIDYMVWERIGYKVRMLLKLKGMVLVSKRQSGYLVKKSRVWRIK